MFLAGRRVTQETPVPGRIDHEEVRDRVALFRATVVGLLSLWNARAIERTLPAIRPNRGGLRDTLRPCGGAAPLKHRRAERGAALAGPRRGSTRQAEDDSTSGRSTETSPPVVLGLRGWDGVAQTSARGAVCPPPWGQGLVADALERRLVRGCPSMVQSCRAATNECSTWGRSAVNACSVHPVSARQLPARGVTSASLGLVLQW